MITKIVKSNGSIEDFSPNKINGWGEWASKTLGHAVDWSSVVLETVAVLSDVCDSQLLQERLIKTCLDRGTHEYNIMAGRLYAPYLYKRIFGTTKLPTIKELHNKLYDLGLMVKLNYSDEEYHAFEKMIKHKRDFKATYAELHSINEKYAIRNRRTKQVYESQQFMYMRMAMALAEDQPKDRRMNDAYNWYECLSNKRLNAPTPNHINLGTPHGGYASCCVYTTKDDVKSLAIGDHIAYTMTYMSAGIGSFLNTRTLGDEVRSGAVLHQGKLPYYRSMVGAIKANLKGGRGGAATTFYSIYDPEVNTIIHLKNPMSTEDKKIRGIDYSLMVNLFAAKKAAKNEPIFTFTEYTAPDLFAAFFGPDQSLFETLYNKYENDPTFVKNYVNARDIIVTVHDEGFATGRAYITWIDQVNQHTPFKDPIYSSNLCLEVLLPTEGYTDMRDLYSSEDHGRGEIALCNLAGMIPANIKSDEEYYTTAYYALLMIEKCIQKNDYVFPHLELTSKSRLNAGVGLVGVAHFMAQHRLKYSSEEGKKFIHWMSERHMYMLIKASAQLARELGPAPWIHKTKWVDGWMPIDTYTKAVDDIVPNELAYNWDQLRQEVKEVGGLRNSCLVAHMPAETSSKASGTTNGVYPIRSLSQLKGDTDAVIQWAAPETGKLGKYYETAYEIPTKSMIEVYAIIQKFTDQGISADVWHKLIKDQTIGTTELLGNFFYMTKFGQKTRYYVNTRTSDGVEFEAVEEVQEAIKETEKGCVGGSCSL